MRCSQTFRDISQYSSDGVLFFDHNHTIQHANTAFCDMVGLPSEKLIGMRLEKLFAKQHDKKFFSALTDGLQKNKSWKGSIAFADENALTGKNPAVIMSLEQEEAVTELYLALFTRQEPAESKNYDRLTGLAGPSIFFDRVGQALIGSRRDKSRTAVLLVNIDRLSLINDGLGYTIGDKVIQIAAKRLAGAFRESDTVARMVGDTFALLIKITADDHAALVAEKVLRCLRKPIKADGQEIAITASIGIATARGRAEHAKDTFVQAESALNRAKEMGGDLYQFFSKDLNKTAKNRIEMENDLRSALISNSFLLYYQPKVDIRTNNIIGMEALIRLKHPSKGIIAPFDFIPVAEETGMIIDIGRWVLHEACRQNKEWQNNNLSAIPVAVNVSARQFQNPEFVQDVQSAIKASGLSPKYLELEITENMLMSDIEQTVDKLKELTGVGLNMAIDDFGTGYSNLSYLLRFPVSTLKIDRAFVKDLEHDHTVAALTRSIIEMSQNLNLKVVAEGAENQDHINFLKEHGCNIVQGYYYSKPLRAEKFGELLKKGISPGSGS